MSQNSPTVSRPGSQRSKPWTYDELERLKEFAFRPATKAEIVKAFPGRSLSAARVQLLKLRRELGVPKTDFYRNTAMVPPNSPPMLRPDDPGVACRRENEFWRRRAEQANRIYLERLTAMVA